MKLEPPRLVSWSAEPIEHERFGIDGELRRSRFCEDYRVTLEMEMSGDTLRAFVDWVRSVMGLDVDVPDERDPARLPAAPRLLGGRRR